MIDTSDPTPTTSRPSRSRSSRVHRARSERQPRQTDERDTRRRRKGSLDGTSRLSTKEISTAKESSRGRVPRNQRTGPSSRRRKEESGRPARTERGPRFSRSKTTSEIEGMQTTTHHPRRSRTENDVKIPPNTEPTSTSAATKELQDATNLNDLVKGIQMASSVHYSHRIRGNLHSSFHGLDSSFKVAGSGRQKRHSDPARRSQQQPQRRGRDGTRRRTKEAAPSDEKIRLLQFDCEKANGLNLVDANIRAMDGSIDSHTESVTEETDSMGNSLSSSSSDDQRLMWCPSEDSTGDHHEQPPQEKDDDDLDSPKKITTITSSSAKSKNKNALKRMSKILTSPLTMRLSLPKNMEELLDLSEHGSLEL